MYKGQFIPFETKTIHDRCSWKRSFLKSSSAGILRTVGITIRIQRFPRLQKVIYYFLFISLLTTCAHIRAADKSLEQKWLPFIEDGKTTKDEVLLKLGIPTGQFEDGRIFTYQMTFSGKEGFRVDYEKTFQYNLVLVFDDRDILQKHQMLELRP